MNPNTPDVVSDACIELITHSEGCEPRAYLCPANRLTIGFGHVLLPKFDWHLFKNCDASRLARLIKECQSAGRMTEEAKVLLSIDHDQAMTLLLHDVQQTALFLSSVTPVKLNQHQFDALVSFVFNVGQGNYATSTLRKKLHAEDYSGAAAELDKWVMGTVNDKKQKLPGLITRRAAERALFESLS